MEFASPYKWKDVFIYIFYKNCLNNDRGANSPDRYYPLKLSNKKVFKSICYVDKFHYLLKKTFSIKNLQKGCKRYKQVTILGIKIKIKRK